MHSCQHPSGWYLSDREKWGCNETAYANQRRFIFRQIDCLLESPAKAVLPIRRDGVLAVSVVFARAMQRSERS